MGCHIIPHRDQVLRAAAEGLSGEEVKELERLLNRIYENVSSDGEMQVALSGKEMAA